MRVTMKAKKKKSPRMGKDRTLMRAPEVIQPQQKAALRSEAFARALVEAKSHLNDAESFRVLCEQVASEVASISGDPFKENWPYLQTMLRLVRAYQRSKYREVNEDTLLWITAAFRYLVDPFDLIPDEVPFLGYVDDATVVEFAVSKTKPALDSFMIWETTTES